MSEALKHEYPSFHHFLWDCAVFRHPVTHTVLQNQVEEAQVSRPGGLCCTYNSHAGSLLPNWCVVVPPQAVAMTTSTHNNTSLNCLHSSETKAPHHLSSLRLIITSWDHKITAKIKHDLSLLSESFRMLYRTVYQTISSIPMGNANITYGIAIHGLLLLMDTSYLGVFSFWHTVACRGIAHHFVSSKTQLLVI